MVYFVENRRSKIVHSEGCGHIRHSDKTGIGTFPDLTKAYSCGYRLCRHCNLMQKRYNSEKEKISGFCRQYGLAYLQTDRVATVTTPISKWKIVLNDAGDRMELYHKNSFDKKGSVSIVPNYHCQHVSYNDIGDFLEYIFRHDVYRRDHPINVSRERKKVKKAPPVKGTKRYRKEQKKLEKAKRRRAVAEVLSLIDCLQAK